MTWSTCKLKSIEKSSKADYTSLVALSGLNGHAFGSFKKRGGSYMWLRDSLPQDVPGARTYIYGYDTRIFQSESFQNLADLGSRFRESLKSIWHNQVGKKALQVDETHTF